MTLLSPDLDATTRVGTPRAVKRFLTSLARAKRPIVKTHRLVSDFFGPFDADAEPMPDLALWLRENADFCYAARDGREVMASYHLYRRSFDDQANCPIGDFLRQDSGDGRSRVAYWRHHVDDGLQSEQALALLFHETVKDTQAQLEALGEHLKMAPVLKQPLLPRPIRTGTDYRVARLMGFRPPSTARPGRSGRPKKWWDLFSPEDREFFAAESGDTLVRLGVETSPDWAVSPSQLSSPKADSAEPDASPGIAQAEQPTT